MVYTPLINGAQYEFVQVTLVILGVPIAGISAIDFKDEGKIEEVFGSGRWPVGRTYGQITTSGSITLFHDEIQNIMSVAPNGRLQDIPEFDIIITLIDTINGGVVPRTFKIRNCRFKNNTLVGNNTSSAIENTLDIAISHIEWR